MSTSVADVGGVERKSLPIKPSITSRGTSTMSQEGNDPLVETKAQDQYNDLEEPQSVSPTDDPARTPRIEDHSDGHVKGIESSQPGGVDYFGNITTQRKSSSGFLTSLTSSNMSSPLQSTYASSASLQSSSDQAGGVVSTPDPAEVIASSQDQVVLSGAAVSVSYHSAITPMDAQIKPHSSTASTTVQPEGPHYPDQSQAAFQAQTITLPYSFLKARNSDYATKHSSLFYPARSSDRLSQTSLSLSADHTPLQSPGLYQPRKRGSDRHGSKASRPSLLHPTHHARVTKETSKLIKDFDSVTGNKIMNDYEVFEKLGVGSHGAVKRARNLNTGEDVAIKIVRRYGKKGRLGKHESPEDKVRKEVAVLKKARHPHVVSLLEVIDDPEAQKVYLVLEFVRLGEIIWRTETTKDIARFEMNRVKRELSGLVNQAHESELVAQFNQKVERTRAMTRIAKQERERGFADRMHSHTSEEDDRRSHRLTISDYSDVSAQSPSESGSGQDHDHGWSNENGGNESDVEYDRPLHTSSRLNRALSPAMLKVSHTHEHGHWGSLDHGQLPETPASLVGSQYGPYSEDDRSATSSEFDLSRYLHYQPPVHEEWTMEENAYKFVPCMTMSQAREAFRDTVLGLEYLHYQGIIHRDIKPANLLWTDDYRVKISDFGVSHIGKPIRDNDQESEDEPVDLDEEYELAKTVGTPAFYAPELCDPEWFNSESSKVRPRVTGQIDVWALGVSLYAMIYGRLPFFDEVDQFAMYEKIARQEAFLSSHRLRGIDEDGMLTNSNKRSPELIEYEVVDDTLKDLLKRLLIKDPAKRVTLREVKRHPWVIYGLEDPEVWVNETDPSRHSEGKKIEVSNKDVDFALAPLNLVDRIKTSIRRLGSVVRGRDSRRRAESNAKETSGSNSSRSATVDRDARRPSLRGDEQIFSALKASREATDHPLAQSVMTSPVAEKSEPFSFVRPISHIQFPTTPGAAISGRPAIVERTESTTESIRTIKPATSTETKSSRDTPMIPEDAGRNESAASSSSGLSGLLGVASRRLANTMRSSKDRGGDSKDNSSPSSRSSSVENMAGSLEDPHAFPSIGLSPAVASGQVDHSLLDPDSAVSVYYQPHPPHESRIPEQSSPQSYARAEQQNRRRQLSEYEQQQHAKPPRSPGRSAYDVLPPCPPSPDDLAALASASGSSAEHLGSLGAVSSSEQMALQEMYSNPSIPSSRPSVSHPDGGASMLATAETVIAACTEPSKTMTAPATPGPITILATADSGEEAKHQERQRENDEAGYHGDGDSDEEEDEGIVMMAGRR